MKYRLKDKNKQIPGDWLFYQTGPKPHVFGAGRKFAKDMATDLHSFRTANSLPRASYDECYEDVVDYNGERLGKGDPDYFFKIPGGTASEQFSPPPSTGCKGCGAKLE